MKKSLVLAILGVTAGVTASYGQGAVFFSNYYSTTATQGVYYALGASDGLYVGPEISAILIWGASTDTLITQLTAVAGSTVPFGLGAATGPGALGTGAGWFSGGSLTINGGVPGTFAFAFEATDGTYAGYSAIFDVATSANSLMNPTTFPVSMYNFAFTDDPPILEPTPEPTTLALGALGGLSLWLMRRKKA